MLSLPGAFTLYIKSKEKLKHDVFDEKKRINVNPTEERDDKNALTNSRTLISSDGSSKNGAPTTANDNVINNSALDLNDKDGSFWGCLEFFSLSLLILCSNQNASNALDNNQSHHLELSTEAERTPEETSLQHRGNKQRHGERNTDTHDTRDQAEKSSVEKKMPRSTRAVLVPHTLKCTRVQKLTFGRAKDYNINATIATTSLKRTPSSKVQGNKINHSGTEITYKKGLEQQCKRVPKLTSFPSKDVKADSTTHAEDFEGLEMQKKTRIKKLSSVNVNDFKADAINATASIKQDSTKVQSAKLTCSASVLSKGRDLEQIEGKKENVVDDCNDISNGLESSTGSRPTSNSLNDVTNKSELPKSLKFISTEKKLQTLHRGRWKDAGQF